MNKVGRLEGWKAVPLGRAITGKLKD